MQRSRVIAIIPARYNSSRFPGKLLTTILGKSVLQRTYESTLASKKIDTVLIATDDSRIAEHVHQFGGKTIFTSPDCPTGSDRLVEVLKNYPELTRGEIIVNIQGDEPCIAHATIDAVIEAMNQDPTQVMTTAVIKIVDPAEILNPSVVKCVMNQRGEALYFSRSPIPGLKPGNTPVVPYFQHLGVYAFRRDFLLTYGALPMTPLQITEDLEHLKVLEAGYKIKVVQVEGTSPHVDVPEDIQKVINWLCIQNTSL